MRISAYSQDVLRYKTQKPAKIFLSCLPVDEVPLVKRAMANEDANQTFEFEVEDKQEQKESKNKESPSAADILKRIRECYGESVAKAFEGEKF